MTLSAFDRGNTSRFGNDDNHQPVRQQRKVWSLFAQHDTDYPIQILNPPAELFPEGFPVLERHWVNNGAKNIPLWCTKEMTGKCLTCYAKENGYRGTIDKFGNTQPLLIVPIYDFSKYRKAQNGRYEVIPPHIPVFDEGSVIPGGFKYLELTDAQFRSLKLQNDNISNLCSSCNTPMNTEGLSCSECGTYLYESKQLSLLTSKDYSELLMKMVKCPVCGATTRMVPDKTCPACRGKEAKTLHDVVVIFRVTRVPVMNGKARNSSSFTLAPTYQPKTLDQLKEEGIDEFWNRFLEFTKDPQPLTTQASTLGMEIPTEWSSSLMEAHATPYQQ